MILPEEETVQIVDEENREIGAVTRSIMREQNLIHRATYIFIQNREGKLFIQKRSASKDVYPGYWEAAAGGVVLAGETYEESARRELEEELGLRNVPLTTLFDYYFESPENRVWGRIFHCRHDGPFRLQKEEIEYGFFMDLKNILQLHTSEPLTPDTIVLLQRLRAFFQSTDKNSSREIR